MSLYLLIGICKHYNLPLTELETFFKGLNVNHLESFSCSTRLRFVESIIALATRFGYVDVVYTLVLSMTPGELPTVIRRVMKSATHHARVDIVLHMLDNYRCIAVGCIDLELVANVNDEHVMHALLDAFPASREEIAREALLIAVQYGFPNEITVVLLLSEIHCTSCIARALLAACGNFERIDACDKRMILDLLIDGLCIDDALSFVIRYGRDVEAIPCYIVCKILVVYQNSFSAGCLSRTLVAAAEYGHGDIVSELLFAKKARADVYNGKALMVACERGHTHVVRMLLDCKNHPARANSRRGKALVLACKNGHTDVVYMLLTWEKHPALADSFDGQALLEACKTDHEQIVSLLIGCEKHAPRADCWNGQALINAARSDGARVVSLLLERGVPPDCQNGAAMFAAIECRNYDAANLLLHSGRWVARLV